MKPLRQLIRQPIKSLLGICLIAMAVAILLTCVGQYIATSLTRAEIENSYNTIALNTDAVNSLIGLDYGAYTNWFQQTVMNDSSIVKMISNTGLLSVYIPELAPDNYTQHYQTVGNHASKVYGAPYTCAVLVVKLDEVGTEITEDKVYGTGSDGAVCEQIKSVSMCCKGTVEQVIALQEGFNDPVGYTIDLTIKVPDEAALKAMELEVGQQYLVYGMDYYDNDWLFRKIISKDASNFSQPFDWNKVYEDHPLGPEYEVSDMLGTKYYYYENTVLGQKVYVHFSAEMLSYAQNCSLTICDFASLSDLVFKLDENNNVLGFNLLQDQRVMLEDENSDALMQHGSTLLHVDEYMQLYSTPTIVRLDGHVEELLSSSQGARWQNVINTTNINNHAFPVLAVDKLGYQAEFARAQARIVQGRDFSQSELESGGKVCILSESLAMANGFAVGDTITIQSYFYDPNVNEDVFSYPQTAFPDASFYSSARGFSSEPEAYTIIGLYRQENEWVGGSSYGFTPNTVFIPKTSMDSKMVMGTEGVFRTIVLHNSKLVAFKELTVDAGYEDFFVYYDQGYPKIVQSLDAYEDAVRSANYIGIVAYGVIFIIFLLLYPGGQAKVNKIMSDLGAPASIRLLHIIINAFGILLPGTVLGVFGSIWLQERMSAELMASISVNVPLIFDGISTTIAVAAIQFLCALTIVVLYALTISKSSGMKRK